MPDLNQLPVPQYSAGQPYHWEYDNLPLKTLEQRDELINGQVDIQGAILNDSAGTQGTLTNRLSQSIDPNGNLMPAAVDQAMHSIAEHTDALKTVSAGDLAYYISLGFPALSNPVSFVRMIEAERDKLALIADEATNMTLEVQSISNITLFTQGPVQFAESASIGWQIEAPNVVKPNLKISTAFAHRHYYNLAPVMIPTPVPYQYYKVNSLSTPFIEDSLRVYINGVRLNADYSVYVPDSNVANWNLNKYTPSYLAGTFYLDIPITVNDVITIDFDVSLT